MSEGTYFGPRLVTWLYDRTAGSYDSIKDIPPGWDQERLAEPLVLRIGKTAGAPLVLDLATGTARLPMALLAEPGFHGQVIGLDLSAGMLQHGWRKVGGWTPRVHLVKAPVFPAPFGDGAFAAVCMVEALEFTPNPRVAIAEMVRLLAPGGTLLITNRVGWEARLMPHRAFRRDAIASELRTHALDGITHERWQTHYDLIWATKRTGGESTSPDVGPADQGIAERRAGRGSRSPDWLIAARCPRCEASDLRSDTAVRLRCTRCACEWGWSDGYWDFQEPAS